jgi:hypothetical protein
VRDVSFNAPLASTLAITQPGRYAYSRVFNINYPGFSAEDKSAPAQILKEPSSLRPQTPSRAFTLPNC